MKALIVRELRALKIPALVVLAVLIVALALEAPIGRAAPNGFWYVLLPLVGFAMGCWLIARERSARETEFSNSWPVSRRQVWWAKLIVGLLAIVLVYAIVLGAALALPGMQVSGFLLSPSDIGPLRVITDHLAPTIALFGLGLLMSTIRPSPFDAMGASLLAAVLLLVGLWFAFCEFVPQHWGPQIGLWPLNPPVSMVAYIAFAVMLCLACAIASYVGFTRTLPLQFGRRTWLTLGAGVALTVVMIGALPVGLWLFGEPGLEDIRAIMWAQTSPDGRWIAFDDVTPPPRHAEDGSGVQQWSECYRLWIVRGDGGDLRCVARWPVRITADWESDRWLPFAWGPSWSDSFMANQGRWLWTWDMERMAPRKLPHPPDDAEEIGRLTVSPDGEYLMGAKLLRLGEHSRKIDAELPLGGHFAGWGRNRAYVDVAKGGREALWAITLPGGGLKRVAEAPDTGQWGASVSPDERWIAWSQYDGERSTLVLEETATGREWKFEGLSRLWHGWSPDGRFLWSRGPSGYRVIPLATEPTDRAMELPVGSPGLHCHMHWSPDGGWCALAVQEEREGNHRRRAVLVAKADGGNLHQVAASPGRVALGMWQLVGWLADGRVVILEEHTRFVAIDPDTREREVVFEVR